MRKKRLDVAEFSIYWDVNCTLLGDLPQAELQVRSALGLLRTWFRNPDLQAVLPVYKHLLSRVCLRCFSCLKVSTSEAQELVRFNLDQATSVDFVLVSLFHVKFFF
jgi:hypothetical protein